jgi:hypothetical protein
LSLHGPAELDEESEEYSRDEQLEYDDRYEDAYGQTLRHRSLPAF